MDSIEKVTEITSNSQISLFQGKYPRPSARFVDTQGTTQYGNNDMRNIDPLLRTNQTGYLQAAAFTNALSQFEKNNDLKTQLRYYRPRIVTDVERYDQLTPLQQVNINTPTLEKVQRPGGPNFSSRYIRF